LNDNLKQEQCRQTKNEISRQRSDHMIAFIRDAAETRVNSRLIDERRCIPPNLILDLAREGFLGMQVEERHAGKNLTHVDALRIIEQTAAVDPNLALLLSVQNAIGIPPVRNFAQDEVRDKVLPILASGSALGTIAASEPGAAGNFGAIATRAVKRGDGYVLNGEKRWISLGAWSEYISVFAQLEDEHQKPIGITGFLVKNGTPGYRPIDEALTYGMKGIPQNYIRIENLHVEPHMLLGAEGQGKSVAQNAFMCGRLYVTAMSLGAMKRCLQIADRYAHRRASATGRLFDNGVTHAILSKSITATRVVETLVYTIAERLDQGVSVPTELYFACKIMGTEFMWKVIDRSVQMLGARGFLDTNVVGQYFRDYRLMRIFEGPTELMLVYLGTMISKNEQPFFELLARENADPTIIEKLHGSLERMRSSHSNKGVPESHVFAASLGLAACWGIITVLMQVKAHRTNDPVDHHTTHWCEQSLRRSIRRWRRCSRLSPISCRRRWSSRPLPAMKVP
jgi:alkylation response protein AidB-like acyl-CoA dehydrogenase